jgi:hypothetical protein
MPELVFEVIQEANGGYCAGCLTENIFTQANTWDELRQTLLSHRCILLRSATAVENSPPPRPRKYCPSHEDPARRVGQVYHHRHVVERRRCELSGHGSVTALSAINRTHRAAHILFISQTLHRRFWKLDQRAEVACQLAKELDARRRIVAVA